MKSETPLDKLTRARTAMLQSQRFWGSLAIRLKLVPRTNIDTMQVDGVHLFYSPKFVEEQRMPELIGSVAHEVAHVAKLHHTRRRGRDPKMWNKACDYAVNPMLIRAGFSLPDDTLNEPAFEGKSAEQIYRILDDERKSQQSQQPQPGEGEPQEGDGGGGSEEPEDSGAGNPGADEPEPDEGEQEGEGSGSPSGEDEGSEEPGSGAGEGEPGGDPGGCGEVLDAVNDDGSEPSPADIAGLEAAMQVAVVQAENFAKQAGQGSTDQERMVEELKQAQQDWKEELRRFCLARAKNETDWCRPNKRFVGAGIYLPSARSQAMGHLAVAADLSGSTMDWIQDFFAQLAAIKEDVQPERLTVIYHTDRVVAVEEFSREEELVLRPHGLGGTDFRPVFKWIEESGEEPDCLVMLTDLEGPAPTEPPDYPVLWACTDEGQNVHEPWGEFLQLRR